MSKSSPPFPLQWFLQRVITLTCQPILILSKKTFCLILTLITLNKMFSYFTAMAVRHNNAAKVRVATKSKTCHVRGLVEILVFRVSVENLQKQRRPLCKAEEGWSFDLANTRTPSTPTKHMTEHNLNSTKLCFLSANFWQLNLKRGQNWQRSIQTQEKETPGSSECWGEKTEQSLRGILDFMSMIKIMDRKNESRLAFVIAAKSSRWQSRKYTNSMWFTVTHLITNIYQLNFRRQEFAILRVKNQDHRLETSMFFNLNSYLYSGWKSQVFCKYLWR